MFSKAAQKDRKWEKKSSKPEKKRSAWIEEKRTQADKG